MAISPGTLRRGIRIAVAATVVIAAVAIRVVVSARAELARADQLHAEGDIDASIVHYRRAARWYAPGSPFHKRALSSLMKIGRQAERRGETGRALTAYRAVRSAIMSTRSFYTPESERLQAADQRIAALMASLPPPLMDAGKSRAELEQEHLALLRARVGPDTVWTCILLFGFVGWVGAAFVFTFRAIDEENRFVVKEVRLWGTIMVLCFGLFVMGMAFA